MALYNQDVRGTCTWYLQWAPGGGAAGASNNWNNTINCPPDALGHGDQGLCKQPVASWTCAKIAGGGLCTTQNLAEEIVGKHPTAKLLNVPTGTWIPDTGGQTDKGVGWNKSAPAGFGNPIITYPIGATAPCDVTTCCEPRGTCSIDVQCQPGVSSQVDDYATKNM